MIRFETNTEQFYKAVLITSRFVERRPNLPTLSGILVAAENGRLLLRSTNLECGVELSLPAKAGGNGVVVIPAHTLLGFLSNVKSKSVTVSQRGELITIESERMIASMRTLPHEDFPTLPHVSASTSFSTKTVDIMRALKSVAYCASTSTVKPELQSVLLYGEVGKLYAVATDSFRLAEKVIPLRTSGSVPHMLFPARNATEFIRILENNSGDIDIYYSENQISSHVETVYFTSRLLDGSFPNYKQIVPKSFSTEAVVLREDFAQALKALSVFADKFSHISFSIEPSKKALVLSARNPDIGEQTTTIHATVSGEAVSMSFNGRYLSESMQSISGESIRIQSNGAGKAILIRDAVDTTFLYMAMPMNR